MAANTGLSNCAASDLHTILNNTILLSAKYCQNWLVNVEDIASQSNVIFGTHTA